MISYLLFLSSSFILVMTIVSSIHIEFHSWGFLILISFSFSIASMGENLLTGKVSIAFLYKTQCRAGWAGKPNLYVWNFIKFLLHFNIQTETWGYVIWGIQH